MVRKLVRVKETEFELNTKTRGSELTLWVDCSMERFVASIGGVSFQFRNLHRERLIDDRFWAGFRVEDPLSEPAAQERHQPPCQQVCLIGLLPGRQGRS